MNKTYYDILEININASQEIIEKAYKTLVKKYHPDLQEENKKIKYEEKIKEINKAYMVLSNKDKKKIYDLNLHRLNFSNEDYNNLYNENINLKKEINYLKNKETLNNNYNYKKNINNNSNSNTIDFFIKTIKNKIKKTNCKKQLKNLIAFIFTIIILIILSFILWHIPFTKNYLINLYNENDILKNIYNLFITLFT